MSRRGLDERSQATCGSETPPGREFSLPHEGDHARASLLHHADCGT